MTMDSNFMQNLFQGQVRPLKKPIYKSPPVWQSDPKGGYKIGDSDRFFVSCKVYIQGANLQFPDSAIKISFYGAQTGCFTRLRDSNDLRNLAEFLNTCAEKIDTVFPTVKAEEVKVKSALAAYQAALSMPEVITENDGHVE